MNLSNKPCYPTTKTFYERGIEIIDYIDGITFRERLIIALASNLNMMVGDDGDIMNTADISITIIKQADEIIKQLEEK